MMNSREVELRVIFIGIGEIDTVNQKFFAEILVEAKWEDPNLCSEFINTAENSNTEEKELTSSQKYWNPKIYIENIINDPKQTVHHRIKKVETVKETEQSQFRYWIYEYRKTKGFFFEKLELEYFPVDIQDLSVIISSYRSNKEVRLLQNKTRQSIVNYNVNIDNNIWLVTLKFQILLK